ncbi:MAG TPA: hypothetical protein PLP42_22630 [Acidobacteriota bacterium]|nr:hypothetical protein [Acidobacteriota bacterium]
MAKVRFLKHDQIENAALCLLAEYGRKYGAVSEPPVPVEEILSAHLGLTLDFDDLPTRLGTPDVLGATRRTRSSKSTTTSAGGRR